MQTVNDNAVQAVETSVNEYEAPRIESVLTPEELEREVAYAGGTISHPPIS